MLGLVALIFFKEEQPVQLSWLDGLLGLRRRTSGTKSL